MAYICCEKSFAFFDESVLYVYNWSWKKFLRGLSCLPQVCPHAPDQIGVVHVNERIHNIIDLQESLAAVPNRKRRNRARLCVILTGSGTILGALASTGRQNKGWYIFCCMKIGWSFPFTILMKAYRRTLLKVRIRRVPLMDLVLTSLTFFTLENNEPFSPGF